MIPRIQIKQPRFNSRMIRRNAAPTGRLSMMLPMTPQAARMKKVDDARGTLAKKRYPYQDFDRDGVINKNDCQPYNPRKQDAVSVAKGVWAAVSARKEHFKPKLYGEGAPEIKERWQAAKKAYEESDTERKQRQSEELSKKILIEEQRVKLAEIQARKRKLNPGPAIVPRSGGGSMFGVEPRTAAQSSPGYFSQPSYFGNTQKAPIDNPYRRMGIDPSAVERAKMQQHQQQIPEDVSSSAKKQGLSKGGMFIKSRRVYLRPEEIEQIKNR